MIEPTEALKLILAASHPLDTVQTGSTTATGYTLAQDVIATSDIPSFDNSAMDGFAVRHGDIEGAGESDRVTLEIIDDQPAGQVSAKTVRDGTAIKVMTGAPIPAGTECVVPVEHTEYNDDRVEVFKPVKMGANIRYAGEDMASGSLALKEGTILRPVDIGLLASLGVARVDVVRKPTVAILGTGDELISIEEPLEPGKIRDSNSYVLLAAALMAGSDATRLGVARDTKEDVRAKLEEATKFDVTVTSGGVSVGERDFVKEVLRELGAEEVFWKIAQKPGKPMAFWRLGHRLIFALPGNPVASALCFEEYVRPALLKLMGRKHVNRPIIKAVLEGEIRKKPGRMHFVGMVARQENGVHYVCVNGPQGSGILKGLSGANAVGLIPRDAEALHAGEVIDAQLIDMPEDH